MISRLKEAFRWRFVRFNENKVQPLLVNLGLKKYQAKLKQEAMFIEALEEKGVNVRLNKLVIDHETPNCYYDHKKYQVIFPKRYVKSVSELDTHKAYTYYFKGLKTDQRLWVLSFKKHHKSLIEFTQQGRLINKDHFDTKYYAEMCASKFVLCPQGKFLWTYRFYEAVMCKSIPVISRGSFEPSMEGFKFYYSDEDSHEYNKEWVDHNYSLFIKRHTLKHD